MRRKATRMTAIDTHSDKAIRDALKRAADTGNTEKISDGAGLRLDARSSGAGWWRLHHRFGGKEGMLSLGTYPEERLSLARQRRDEARTLVAVRTDPSAARKTDKEAQAAEAAVTRNAENGLPATGTFEAVAREWLAVVHDAKVSAGLAERTRIRFEQDMFYWIGMQALAALEAPRCWPCCAG